MSVEQGDSMTSSEQHLIEVNKRQAAFYDKFETEDEYNVPSRLWRRFRDRVRATADVNERVDAFERAAFSTIRPRRVLEVGCYNGREQSDWLLGSPWLERYVGLDLSTKAIERFAARLDPRAAAKAELRVGDFLLQDFSPASFDVVYMHSTFHHFPDSRSALDRVVRLLAPGGSFITFDPTLTNPIFRAARSLYRPFQSDRDWEWPLRRDCFALLEERFELGRVQGFLGIEMYGAMLYALAPVAVVDAWRKRTRAMDEAAADRLGAGLYRCNSVVMWWQLRS
jgi:SAM-dependent methyltransferase